MIYHPGTSLLHHLHPLTKLAIVAMLGMTVYLFHTLWLAPLIFALLLLIAHRIQAAGALLRVIAGTLLPLFCSLFLIQGLLFPPIGAQAIAQLGPVRLTDGGLLLTFTTATRLLVLCAGLMLLMFTTHPADLTAALTQIGIPRGIGYIVLVSIQIIPDMLARAQGILDAQQSRGLDVRGLRRLWALPALVGPLIVGALADVEERAMAIESRAFLAEGPKTDLRRPHDSPRQRGVRWGALTLIGVMVIARCALLVVGA